MKNLILSKVRILLPIITFCLTISCCLAQQSISPTQGPNTCLSYPLLNMRLLDMPANARVTPILADTGKYNSLKITWKKAGLQALFYAEQNVSHEALFTRPIGDFEIEPFSSGSSVIINGNNWQAGQARILANGQKGRVLRYYATTAGWNYVAYFFGPELEKMLEAVDATIRMVAPLETENDRIANPYPTEVVQKSWNVTGVELFVKEGLTEEQKKLVAIVKNSHLHLRSDGTFFFENEDLFKRMLPEVHGTWQPVRRGAFIQLEMGKNTFFTIEILNRRKLRMDYSYHPNCSLNIDVQPIRAFILEPVGN